MEETLQPPKIDHVRVDLDEIERYSSEEEFMELTVKLLIEAGQYVCIAACLLPARTKAWDRDEAIVGGLLVRMFKLISAMLDQTCQRRRETSVVLARLAFECVINVKYFIQHGSEDVFQAFVAYSLRHERRLFDELQTNIQERGGEVLPIERRMVSSIQKSVDKSEVRLESITKESMSLWKNQTLYQRAEAVDMGEQYLFFIGGSSHSVHGNWQDLLEYHLEASDSGFKPDLDWHYPRPQVLLVLAIYVVDTIKEYLVHKVGNESGPLQEELDELAERIWAVNEGHERFLSKHQSE